MCAKSWLPRATWWVWVAYIKTSFDEVNVSYLEKQIPQKSVSTAIWRSATAALTTRNVLRCIEETLCQQFWRSTDIVVATSWFECIPHYDGFDICAKDRQNFYILTGLIIFDCCLSFKTRRCYNIVLDIQISMSRHVRNQIQRRQSNVLSLPPASMLTTRY